MTRSTEAGGPKTEKILRLIVHEKEFTQAKTHLLVTWTREDHSRILRHPVQLAAFIEYAKYEGRMPQLSSARWAINGFTIRDARLRDFLQTSDLEAMINRLAELEAVV